uniref:NADH dehydrogenase [ubiquinone] 1 alpha subcomplex subunit 13 n=1 Tax=Ditylenchus dipsaci TaxID=166011 RepID=A0A915DY56_9BILA
MGDKIKQDLPPSGGYQRFNWHRTYAKALWKPRVVIPIFIGTGIYGYYQLQAKMKAKSTLKFEDVDIYNAMYPFLTAERDRRWLKFLNKNRDYENEVMKNVKGWKTGTWYGEPVYFTLGDKWWDPGMEEVFAHSPTSAKEYELHFDRRDTYQAPKWWHHYVPEYVRVRMF